MDSMAPSRRMQKQGPPPSLDEGLVSKKRKLGASTNGAVKKQRKDRDVPKSKTIANGGPRGATNSAGKAKTKGDFRTLQKSAVAPKKRAASLRMS